VKKILGCGVAEHPEECLCDVIITKPTKTVVGALDFYGASIIIEKLGISHPWTSADLADFLELLGKGHAAVTAMNNGMSERGPKKFSIESDAFMKSLIIDGLEPSPIVRLVKKTHGVDMTVSHVSYTRSRMRKRGQL